MADVPELDQFDTGIYQLETADPVLGGVGGIANAQAKGLANRTKYLKREVELRAPLISPALQGTPTAPTAAAGTNTTQLATAAFVQSALAALVAGAPTGLDTLDELAAAIGDDVNFAATMTNALGLKAPLASPALTGNPTGPTAAQFDNDTSLATTGFVQRALGNMQGATQLAVDAVQTLTAADAGKYIQLQGGTITLPAVTGLLPGATFNFSSSANTTIKANAAGDNIFQGASGANSFVLSGESVTLVYLTGAAGAAVWEVAGGTAMMGKLPVFSSQLSSSGYQKLPSGLIIQWGQWNQADTTNASTAFSIGYNIAFPTAALQGFLTVGSNINATAVYGSIEDLSSKTSFAGFTWSSNTITRVYRWLVIGH